MKKRPLIHIGYHKTATSWMQELMFTPENGYRQIAGHEEVFELITKPHGLWFDPKPMQNLIERAVSVTALSEVPVISSEILCGNHFYGGRESDVYAERLHKIVPDARILITIRSQLRILPSVYMQYLSRGGTMPYPQFFEEKAGIGYFAFNSNHFEYDRLLSFYIDLFGEDNVLVLNQESLKKDMDKTALMLAQFCDNTKFTKLSEVARKVHAASYPEHAVPVLRRINHIQSSQLNPAPVLHVGKTPGSLYRAAGYLLKKPPLSTALSSYRPVSDYVRSRFQGRYAESNRRLAALVQSELDLSVYDGIGS